MTVVVSKLEDIEYSEVNRFVGDCKSSDDLAITSKETTGSFFCPVVNREVKISEGMCQENPRTCKEHA